MRAVIQRVAKAKVEVKEELVSEIKQGLMVLVGVTKTDTKEDIEYIASKISNLRIFTDQDGKMNLSLKDIGGEILLISQFTLYGDARKGRRPSFTESASGEFAEKLYEDLIEYLKNEGFEVKTGKFGADMQVSLVNDGPVTIQLDSSKIY